MRLPNNSHTVVVLTAFAAVIRIVATLIMAAKEISYSTEYGILGYP